MAWIALFLLRFVFDWILELPRTPFPDQPIVVIVPYILMASIVAGVAEESGFRGYMQGPIEREKGPFIAILVVGTLFWFAHFGSYIGHFWLFAAHSWFYFGAAAIFGILTYLTGSILPAIFLHSGANILGFSFLWWWASLPSVTVSTKTILLGLTPIAIVLIIASVKAYQQLALITFKTKT